MTPTQLRALMSAAGIATQVQLAERVGVHKVTVTRWMTGRTPIGPASAALIREKLAARTN